MERTSSISACVLAAVASCVGSSLLQCSAPHAPAELEYCAPGCRAAIRASAACVHAEAWHARRRTVSQTRAPSQIAARQTPWPAPPERPHPPRAATQPCCTRTRAHERVAGCGPRRRGHALARGVLCAPWQPQLQLQPHPALRVPQPIHSPQCRAVIQAYVRRATLVHGVQRRARRGAPARVHVNSSAGLLGWPAMSHTSSAWCSVCNGASVLVSWSYSSTTSCRAPAVRPAGTAAAVGDAHLILFAQADSACNEPVPLTVAANRCNASRLMLQAMHHSFTPKHGGDPDFGQRGASQSRF